MVTSNAAVKTTMVTTKMSDSLPIAPTHHDKLVHTLKVSALGAIMSSPDSYYLADWRGGTLDSSRHKASLTVTRHKASLTVTRHTTLRHKASRQNLLSVTKPSPYSHPSHYLSQFPSQSPVTLLPLLTKPLQSPSHTTPCHKASPVTCHTTLRQSLPHSHPVTLTLRHKASLTVTCHKAPHSHPPHYSPSQSSSQLTTVTLSVTKPHSHPSHHFSVAKPPVKAPSYTISPASHPSQPPQSPPAHTTLCHKASPQSSVTWVTPLSVTKLLPTVTCHIASCHKASHSHLSHYSPSQSPHSHLPTLLFRHKASSATRHTTLRHKASVTPLPSQSSQSPVTLLSAHKASCHTLRHKASSQSPVTLLLRHKASHHTTLSQSLPSHYFRQAKPPVTLSVTKPPQSPVTLLSVMPPVTLPTALYMLTRDSAADRRRCAAA
ncbi:extensin-like [Homarus americanus]|uniref:extensin-like n=1 Tax=Homarus americanus TaxID=6706 RepID=UPI001C478A94|nr:extensin-like [Homarus americanus]